MRPGLLFGIAAFFAVLAGVLWLVFLRPVPIRSVSGSIAQKTFKPGGTYWQYPSGIRQGFRTANPIPVAESYVFEVDVEGWPGPAHFALNTVASEQFEVGQRVSIEFQQRGLPPLWSRIYVLDMRPDRSEAR